MATTSVSNAQLAAGSEILVLDTDLNVRAGMEHLFREAGMAVTALSDEAQARRLMGEKFFAVVIVDLDTPSPGEGLTLVAEVKERSPASAVIVMTPRKVFESAVRAFRQGAADVIAKAPDQVEYLRHRVIELAAESRVDLDRRQLLEEASAVHEEFLRRMMETARKVIDLEERLGGRSTSESPTDAVATSVLVVDQDPTIYETLRTQLAADAEWWRIRSAQTGGEALDVASQEPVHIALIKETLPDLAGKMIVRGLCRSSPQTLAVVYGASAEAVLQDGSISLPLAWGGAAEVVARVRELREALRAKSRERRYLQAFRAQHYDFLRRYAELKHRFEKMLKPGS